jgi:hypothetical protein
MLDGPYISPEYRRLGPRGNRLEIDDATLDAAVEAFLSGSAAGVIDPDGRTGLRRDVAAALRAVLSVTP